MFVAQGDQGQGLEQDMEKETECKDQSEGPGKMSPEGLRWLKSELTQTDERKLWGSGELVAITHGTSLRS